MNFIPLWKHNGWWMFDDPATLWSIAAEQNVDLSALAMLYYEAYENEFDDEKMKWLPIRPEGAFRTNVVVQAKASLRGYDVVTYSVHASPECSPLSCNSVAEKIPTNRYCLLDAQEPAIAALEGNQFDHTEPGPYRIIAVYALESDGT